MGQVQIEHIRRTQGLVGPCLTQFAVRPNLALDFAVEKLVHPTCDDMERELVRAELVKAGFELGHIDPAKIKVSLISILVKIREEDADALPAIIGRLGVPEAVLTPIQGTDYGLFPDGGNRSGIERLLTSQIQWELRIANQLNQVTDALLLARDFLSDEVIARICEPLSKMGAELAIGSQDLARNSLLFSSSETMATTSLEEMGRYFLNADDQGRLALISRINLGQRNALVAWLDICEVMS